MNKPRILIFSLAYLPFIGGAEIAVQEITKRLNDDFEFDMITCNLDNKQPEKEIISNITIYRTKNKYLYQWQAFKKAKELYKKNDYKIVWAIMAFWAGWAALKFKEKFPQVKYLLTMQSGDSDKWIKKRTWFWHWRYKQIYKKADYIQVISKWLAERARKFGYKGETSLVPNGVTINSRQLKVNNKKNRKVILTVSRLVKKNGIEDLIKAFNIHNTEYKIQNTKLLIIGDGPLKNKLQNLVKRLELENKVEFMGKIDYKKIPEYYAQADVFVRPSLSEGFGNTFIEAMAVKTPVIGTKVGGIPDFLTDKETGLFCEVNNPEDLAEKINLILQDKNLKNKIVTNAKKMVEEKYTWDIVAQQMQKIFLELIK